jgi:hypothetical protein
MSASIRSLTLRAAAALCLLLTAIVPAVAQPSSASPASGVQFLPRYDFTMSAAALGYDDDRFSWDTHWAGDFDLLDYRAGRATFLGDYQALLGSEFRPFDPYQSNYLLEASGSIRTPAAEVAGVLSHVSRHFGDRFKRIAIAENSLGVRVLRQFDLSDGTHLATRLDLRKVIAQAYVDYEWLGDVDISLRREVSSHAALYGQVIGHGITVDRSIADRGRQYGGRVEAGVRLGGARGAIDLFGGFERMIDADPLDRLSRGWAYFGFRLIGR